jgi:hypothetical protein
MAAAAAEAAAAAAAANKGDVPRTGYPRYDYHFDPVRQVEWCEDRLKTFAENEMNQIYLPILHARQNQAPQQGFLWAMFAFMVSVAIIFLLGFHISICLLGGILIAILTGFVVTYLCQPTFPILYRKIKEGYINNDKNHPYLQCEVENWDFKDGIVYQFRFDGEHFVKDD